MKNERNPIPINSAKAKKTASKKAARHSNAVEEKSPAVKKKAKTAGSKASAGSKTSARGLTSKAGKTSTRQKSAGKSAERDNKADSSKTRDKSANKSGERKNNAAEREHASMAMSAPPRLPENHHPDLHQRSYAAHLDAGPREPHTKPAVNLLRHGALPMGRKQP